MKTTYKDGEPSRITVAHGGDGIKENKPIGGGNVYYTGTIMTPQGYVWLYSQGLGEAKREQWTSLSIILNGKEYRRTWEKAFTPRYLVTLAARFAEDKAAQTQATTVSIAIAPHSLG